ncbi:MAG: hypothetical protein JSR46_08005, partial [Verrucomicrobia bacterium]|nr:hypothetical protein [Verrucomicrobiota bacterium]
MAIEELLRANLETHWYAVNQSNELEVVEKDGKLTRCWKKLFDLCTGQDSYAHARYNQISMAASVAVRHEEDREIVDKYLKLLERIKEKAQINGSPNEAEKSIVARYNSLAFSQTPAAGSSGRLYLHNGDIERIEKTIQEMVEDVRYQSRCLYNDPIILSIGNGLKVKISREGNNLHDTDQKLYSYASGLKKAKSVCAQQGLNLLAVSDAVMVKVFHFGKIRNLLVETELDETAVGPSWWHFEDTKRSNEIVRQLASLTLHTGLNITCWNLRPLKT